MKKKFVVLVEVPKYLDAFHWPKVGDYTNPVIEKIIPCTVENGVYKTWENGEKVEKNSRMFEWNLFSGTMFRFKGKKNVLITRDFQGHQFLVENVKFNPSSMVCYEAK